MWYNPLTTINHGVSGVRTDASQQEGPGFELWPSFSGAPVSSSSSSIIKDMYVMVNTPGTGVGPQIMKFGRPLPLVSVHGTNAEDKFCFMYAGAEK